MQSLPFREAVRALIKSQKERYLIVKENLPEFIHWSLPGGGINENENHKEALIREIKEEISITDIEILDFQPIQYREIWPDKLKKSAYDKFGVLYKGQINHIYFGSHKGNEKDIKIIGKEIGQIEWSHANELKNYLLFWDKIKDGINFFVESNEDI